MDINEYRQDGVLVVEPTGRLDSNTAQGLEQRLLGLLEDQENRMIIDFQQLSYISSAGLRVLLMAAKRMKAKQGKLALCQMNDNIREIFEMSGFDKIFQIFPTLSAATRSLT